jgi:hypothetical protein
MCSWQDWGMDVTMGTLLLAAFLSINMLSLIYLGMIAVGMAAPAGPRRLFWRFCGLPLLALLLIMQYSVSIGLPPPFDTATWLLKLAAGRQHDPDTGGESLKVCSETPIYSCDGGFSARHDCCCV